MVPSVGFIAMNAISNAAEVLAGTSPLADKEAQQKMNLRVHFLISFFMRGFLRDLPRAASNSADLFCERKKVWHTEPAAE